MKLGTPDLRRHEFGDPALAYERDEAGTCAGCVHEERLTWCGYHPYCEIGYKYGRKCPKYRVREAVTRTDGDE